MPSKKRRIVPGFPLEMKKIKFKVDNKWWGYDDGDLVSAVLLSKDGLVFVSGDPEHGFCGVVLVGCVPVDYRGTVWEQRECRPAITYANLSKREENELAEMVSVAFKKKARKKKMK